jgi:F-type H+-transporting ATPase subunit delta
MAEKTTIARPYAQAVFDIAEEQKALGRWSEMLALAAAVAADEEMGRLIDNPRLRKLQVLELFLEICGEGLDPAGQNFIRVLSDNGRLALLPEIAELYEQARAEAEGTLEAEVVSAKPLGRQQQENIAAALSKRLGRKVSLKCTVDESLLGGAVIRAGDLIIDGSAVAKLQRLGLELVH